MRTDADGDGIIDPLELGFTDPLNRDSDGGGASDGWEIAAGTDPTVPGDDPTGPDSDFDWLPDAEEAVLGTDPHNPDSDGYFLDDYLDALLCDPMNVDADGDGVDDRYDMSDMIGRCDTPENCVCNQADRDHDGIPDGEPYGGDNVADGDEDGLVDGVELKAQGSGHPSGTGALPLLGLLMLFAQRRRGRAK